MFNGRVKTHPTLPSERGTRLQSSIGTCFTAGGGGGGGTAAAALVRRLSEPTEPTSSREGWVRPAGAADRSWSARISVLAFLRGGGGFTGVGSGALGTLESRRQFVPDYIQLAVLRDLPETRRCAARLGMQIERLVNGGRSLRWKARSAFGHGAKFIHLRGRQKLPCVGPSLGASLRSHLDQAVPVLDHRELVSVFDRRGDGRLQC